MRRAPARARGPVLERGAALGIAIARGAALGVANARGATLGVAITRGAALGVALVAAGIPLAARADVPRCPVAEAALITKLDSATATAGDAFTFKLTERVPPIRGLPAIPVGTRGYGVVAYADHAHGAGQAGRMVVEPRYLALADGTHVQVMADPQLAEGVVEGASRNLNGALGFVPGIGIAVTGYNALHRGKEVTLAPGTQFRIVIGDELATAECFVPSPDAPDIR